MPLTGLPAVSSFLFSDWNYRLVIPIGFYLYITRVGQKL